MLTLLSDDVQKSMKDLMSLNAGAVEEYSQQQTELITGLISDHINYASSLTKQKDYKEWLNVSQAFTESVRTRMIKSVNATYTTFSEVNEKATQLLKTDVPAPAAPKKPAAKKAVAKPAAKKAPAKAATAEPVKAEPKVEAKPVEEKPAPTKAAAAKPAATKAKATPRKTATKSQTPAK